MEGAAATSFAEGIRMAAEHLVSHTAGLFQGATETFETHLGKPILELTLGVICLALGAAMKEVFGPLLQGVTDVLGRQAEAVEVQTDKNVELLTAQNNTLNQALTALVKAQEQQVQQNEAKAALPKLKPEAPEAFDGSSDKVMAFLTACNLYFIATKETDEQTKIVYALSKIKGGKDDMATKWADAKRAEIFDVQVGVKAAGENQEKIDEWNAKLPFAVWEQFIEKFRAYFMLHDRVDDARDALENLAMGTNTCEHYTTMFNGYATLSGYEDNYLLRRYKDGLTKGLRNKVVGIFPVAVTLNDWKE